MGNIIENPIIGLSQLDKYTTEIKKYIDDVDTDTTYTFGNGTNGFTVTPSNGTAQTVTVTPSIADATTSSSGLMSASDKTKLNSISEGAEVNVQADWNVSDASSDAYIKNKPSIPNEVTESTVASWGFTKNTGTYSKPSDGIPASDLASGVIPTSLPASDVYAWAKAENKPTYTASEVGALPSTTTIPTQLSQLTSDANHRTVTDAEKAAWNSTAPTYSVVSTSADGLAPKITNTSGYLKGDGTWGVPTASEVGALSLNGGSLNLNQGLSLMGEDGISAEISISSPNESTTLYPANIFTPWLHTNKINNTSEYNDPNLIITAKGELDLTSTEGGITLMCQDYTGDLCLANYKGNITLDAKKAYYNDIEIATVNDVAAKQNALSTTQLNATNSGITSTKVSTYDGYATSKQNKFLYANNVTPTVSNGVFEYTLSQLGLSSVPTCVIATPMMSNDTYTITYCYDESVSKGKVIFWVRNGSGGWHSGAFRCSLIIVS